MSKVSRLLKGVSGARSRRAPGPTPQEAIHRLRETEAMLSKKQEYLEQKIEQELAIARKNGTKNKRGVGLASWVGPAGWDLLAALQALKRKKRHEQQLTQIDGTLSTMEFQREALESASINTEVLKNMGYAARAARGVHQETSGLSLSLSLRDLDKIDSLMQDITEQQEVAQEICDAISRPFGDMYDEDDLLAELAELEMEDEEERMKEIARLPRVPSTKTPSSRVPSSGMSSGPPSQRTKSKKRVEHDEDMQRLSTWAT
ncbi:hypothetical protein CRUP_008124 [Coryphaenoides rupestris]|nr:hypothetical protein CRUP_008124 [Coryphaenoides rupestris]